MEVLEFFNELGTDSEVTDLFVVAIGSKDVIAKNWSTMIVVEGDDGVPKEIRDVCKAVGLQLDIIGAMDSDTEGRSEDKSDEDTDGEEDDGADAET
jgi:hypothetical protein